MKWYFILIIVLVVAGAAAGIGYALYFFLFRDSGSGGGGHPSANSVTKPDFELAGNLTRTGNDDKMLDVTFENNSQIGFVTFELPDSSRQRATSIFSFEFTSTSNSWSAELNLVGKQIDGGESCDSSAQVAYVHQPALEYTFNGKKETYSEKLTTYIPVSSSTGITWTETKTIGINMSAVNFVRLWTLGTDVFLLGFRVTDTLVWKFNPKAKSWELVLSANGNAYGEETSDSLVSVIGDPASKVIYTLNQEFKISVLKRNDQDNGWKLVADQVPNSELWTLLGPSTRSAAKLEISVDGMTLLAGLVRAKGVEEPVVIENQFLLYNFDSAKSYFATPGAVLHPVDVAALPQFDYLAFGDVAETKVFRTNGEREPITGKPNNLTGDPALFKTISTNNGASFMNHIGTNQVVLIVGGFAQPQVMTVYIMQL